MKIRILFTIYGILLFSACSEDFVLTEPWKDIPVVYGLINRVDSAQYIRVEKLFVDENIPAVDMAKVADSIYYKNAKVYLINLTSKREVELKKVDGTSEGYPRNSGPFVQVPNILYKLKTSQLQMAGGDSILLKIDRGDGKTQVTSRIQLVRDFDFTSLHPPIERFNLSQIFHNLSVGKSQNLLKFLILTLSLMYRKPILFQATFQ
ncbi:MAG: hypothetical protein IPP06_08195 [Saprospiraceae bacterium]|nr:hypothetical protein [Candidatus Vicinibacter affinis]